MCMHGCSPIQGKVFIIVGISWSPDLRVQHIFDCLKSKNEKHEFEYENLLNGTLKQKNQTLKTFQKKKENRTQLWDSDI